MREAAPKAAACTLAILCAVLLLAGCASRQPPPPPAPIPAARASAPPPTPSQTPAPSDILFTISANVRGTDGSRIGILLAGHAPLAHSDPQALPLSTRFATNCPTDAAGKSLTAQSLTEDGGSIMSLELSSNRPGQTFLAPIQLFLGGPYTSQSVSGAGIVAPPQSVGCGGIYTWTTSAPAAALVDFPGTAATPPAAWRFAHYGFVVAPSSGATIESCNVTITELGLRADPGAVAGWDPSQAATGSTCGIGYSGE